MALGKKLFSSLFGLVLMHLKLLPGGSRSNSARPGWELPLDDLLCSAEASQGVNVHRGGEKAAGDLLCRLCL